jgi:hypothetical protein
MFYQLCHNTAFLLFVFNHAFAGQLMVLTQLRALLALHNRGNDVPDV